MKRLGLGVAVLLIAAAPAGADDHLDRANDALDNLEFDAAREALDAALRAGTNSPADLAEIHLLSGIVAASFGDAQEARAAFRRLLTIDPRAELGDGYAPKIVAPFEAAKLSLDEPLIVRYEPYAYGDDQLVIVVDADPADLVAGVRVVYRDAADRLRALSGDGSSRIAVALPALPVGRVKIGVVDEHGNRLAVMSWVAPGPDAEPGEPAPEPLPEPELPEEEPAAAVELAAEPTSDATPVYARWQLWGGASVGLLAVGAYFGLEVRADQAEFNQIVSNSESYRYEDAVAVLDRGNRHAALANVAFGAAVVTTAVSAYLYLRGRDDETPSVAPAPVRGGAAVSWEVSF